jgi:hypothetical protein
MPKEDIVGKVISTVNKPMNRLVEEVYKRTPNGYTKGERESMEDEQAATSPSWWGKRSKYKNQYEDLIRQADRTPGPLGTKSVRDTMVDDLGGQVEIQTRSRNRSFKRTPEAAKSDVASAKYYADRNSGGARPIQGPVKITDKHAAGAMSGKGLSKAELAKGRIQNLQNEMAKGRVNAEGEAAYQANRDKVAAWDRNNARVATKTLQKDMAKGMTKARAASAKPAPSMRSLMGMPKPKK